VRLVADDEAARLPGVERVLARDLQYDLIIETLHRFGVEGEPDAVCVAVFDHGHAPPGYSDRIFRFDYLREHVRQAADLLAFLHPRAAIPARFTRFQAVADSFAGPQPLFLMDTAAAAIVGALEDPRVAAEPQAILANVGNFHCLAFHLLDGAIVFRPTPRPARFLSVTGPRRGLLAGSRLAPYFAVPHGDMMLAGCFGLLRAAAPHLGLEWS
jgi:uncharacterized protein (DUF1786 family)